MLEECPSEHKCIYVRCLFKRRCISLSMSVYDPVYRDPKFEVTHNQKATEMVRKLDPADADQVQQALRTLIGSTRPHRLIL